MEQKSYLEGCKARLYLMLEYLLDLKMFFYNQFFLIKIKSVENLIYFHLT